MSGWWIAEYYQAGEITLLISWVFWVILSITLHELAHGWTAVWQGDDTPRLLGRLTLNPYVHMGPMSLLVFVIIGIAWGLMPVNPSKFRNRRWGDVMVSAAGPAMNLLLAFIALTAAALWISYIPAKDPLDKNVVIFLTTGGWLNMVLFAFNLLPVPPLDGSTILAGFSSQARRWYAHPNAAFAGMVLVMLIFVTNIFDFVWHGAMVGSWAYVDILARVLPGGNLDAINAWTWTS